MHKIVITGGAGFIGSHITEYLAATYAAAEVVVFDKMTYAADFRNLSDLVISDRIRLVVGDICDYELCKATFEGADVVIHAAAESHVDRSFHSSMLFTQTNVLGTHTVMEACREARVPRIIHISTDEVYGEVIVGERAENGTLNPTNPYSASKAAAEMIVNGYIHSFNLPVILVRANNVFGIRQYPEKLIPRCCISLIAGKKIPLHGDGSNVRHYLSAYDLAKAINLLIRHGSYHEIYNIGSSEEYTNKDVARMVCDAFDVSFSKFVMFVDDRPFNDRRYAITWEKITRLGWAAERNLHSEIPHLVDWYRQNADRFIARSSLFKRKLAESNREASNVISLSHANTV